MHKIYEANNLIDAQLLVDHLHANNIRATIRGHYLSGAIGELPADLGPSVWVVHKRDAPLAKELAKQLESCAVSATQAWTCTNCGETLGASFGLCWQCGHHKPEE